MSVPPALGKTTLEPHLPLLRHDSGTILHRWGGYPRAVHGRDPPTDRHGAPDPFLFQGTVAENIAYGKPDATREEIICAAKAANAHDFITRLPEGYDTIVGEGAGALGERQRISIARAILHDPRILILDEATSSVDTETERQIQEALETLVKGRTTIAIAHRLSTLYNADRIVVLNHGRLEEEGPPRELLDNKGAFYNLVQLQTQLARIDGRCPLEKGLLWHAFEVLYLNPEELSFTRAMETP